MSPEKQLVAYALALDYDSIDAVSRDHVRDIILDTLGIAIGAAALKHDSGLLCEDYTLEKYAGAPGGAATLWSGKGTLPPDEAALCNGTYAEVLDYQDVVVEPRNNGHAGVTIIPAAVAAAELAGASGKELIAAVTAGLEVTLCVLRAIGRKHRSDGRGFRTTSIGAPLGAAVACAKLLGLNVEQTLNAMGIAGACANNGLMPSLSPVEGRFAMDKDWVNGLSAQLGVNAARLAQRGMTGSLAVVTGDRGMLASHAHGDGLPLESPTQGAPDIRFVAIKKYAACYGVHASVEAAMTLMREHAIKIGEIEHVRVRVKGDSAVTLSSRKLANHMAARFSLPYSVASAIVRDRCALEDFEDGALTAPDVLAMMDRIELIADPDLTRFHDETGGFPGDVEITTGRGVFRKRIDYPVGSEQRPMSRDELHAKFRELTQTHFSAAQQDAVLAAAYALADLSDVRELTRLLAAGS